MIIVFIDQQMMTAKLTSQRDKTIASAIRQYGQRLFHFIRNRVSTQADAEDILQDVWFQFSRVLAVQPIEEVSGWLFRVARNRITDNYRKSKPELLADIGGESDEEASFIQEMLLSDNHTPETEILRQTFWEVLFEALDELPDEQRDIFVRNELEGQTFREIAEQTGVNIKTLISRKGYAVRHLRERLQELYDDILDF